MALGILGIAIITGCGIISIGALTTSAYVIYSAYKRRQVKKKNKKRQLNKKFIQTIVPNELVDNVVIAPKSIPVTPPPVQVKSQVTVVQIERKPYKLRESQAPVDLIATKLPTPELPVEVSNTPEDDIDGTDSDDSLSLDNRPDVGEVLGEIRSVSPTLDAAEPLQSTEPIRSLAESEGFASVKSPESVASKSAKSKKSDTRSVSSGESGAKAHFSMATASVDTNMSQDSTDLRSQLDLKSFKSSSPVVIETSPCISADLRSMISLTSAKSSKTASWIPLDIMAAEEKDLRSLLSIRSFASVKPDTQN